MSLAPKADHRLKPFENTVLRKIFGTRVGEGGTGAWRKLCNESFMIYTPHQTQAVLRQ
jgi:hypothetical protein